MKMNIVEPQWGVELLQSINTRVSSNPYLFKMTACIADIVVFLFPIFLLTVYIIGIVRKNRGIKEFALRVLTSTGIAVCINLLIQQCITKARPETVLDGAGHLLLKHLPSMSFPSDHTAVAISFAVAILVFAKIANTIFSKNNVRPEKNYKKIFINWGVFFLIAGILMAVARVAVGVHRPTDILAGAIVGLLAVYICQLLPKKIFIGVISLEEKILQAIGLVKKSK